ncbi:fatty acid cis/trans isomerase [Colwellia sp. E2M01]|uniref:fatty acid cis/trans isomerase n=1 Tax=Colwellia sp. E2M01 TaxID=2841561 RepID=UPI001C092BE7|nr:fatty acid cis/trans isomerase [Colwellia sp. E2M01]MBU2871706.1 fatty acid cis/trans isomerase [Colwellia sp. E2M01]
MRKFNWLLIFILLSGCATLGMMEFDKRYGVSKVENRFEQPESTALQTIHFNETIQPIIENRCVVCHGCYDAPCQLKMESSAGIERGANKAQIYGDRLRPAPITEDISDTPSLTAKDLNRLRGEGFFPVLNERNQTAQANTQASLFYQMLALKKQHPLPQSKLLDDDFDIDLDRDQECATIEEFESYKKDYPLGGMPYALPGLSDTEHNQLTQWIAQGAVMPPAEKPTEVELEFIARWEKLLNGKSPKEQLVARYIYEHLFLANLYFNESQVSYFKLVRSRTPSGEEVEVINSRRPFDTPYADGSTIPTPNNPKVFYRLIKHTDTITVKRHMPYPFGDEKFKRIKALFYDNDYQVTSLPDYELINASNPFRTFEQIPETARYQFLLDQAQFSIMNFIKGPVCRGQTALNVIEDNFWVFFLNPNNMSRFQSDQFLNKNTNLLKLPAGTSDKTLPIFYWRDYAKSQQEYLEKKSEFMKSLDWSKNAIDLDLIWSGNGNPNATLTIFRHFNSASVVKGFVGPKPKTAWAINYPLLERIHYLLVAGFDVYGSISHQLETRLYMDFLRMEAESNFIGFLPKEKRKAIHESWYIDTNDEIKEYIFANQFYQLPDTGIKYQTNDPETELFKLIADYTDNAQVSDYNLTSLPESDIDKTMAGLREIPNINVNLLAQVSFVMVKDGDKNHVYSLINNTAHTNVAELFFENSRLMPEKDTVAVLRGIVGNYPNAFFKVDKADLSQFVSTLTQIKTEEDYSALKDKFAIRRTSPNFWQYADELHTWYEKHYPRSAGLLDFNRLEDR